MQENLTKIQKIERIFEGISSERMSKYMSKEGDNKEKALNLYNKNTKTSEHFYTPLQGFEILFRNTIHKAVSEKYGEKWLFEKNMVKNGCLRKIFPSIIFRKK